MKPSFLLDSMGLALDLYIYCPYKLCSLLEVILFGLLCLSVQLPVAGTEFGLLGKVGRTAECASGVWIPVSLARSRVCKGRCDVGVVAVGSAPCIVSRRWFVPDVIKKITKTGV